MFNKYAVDAEDPFDMGSDCAPTWDATGSVWLWEHELGSCGMALQSISVEGTKFVEFKKSFAKANNSEGETIIFVF